MYGPDRWTYPDGDPDTLANLGPLRPMAGVWEGAKGSDQHLWAEGTERNVFVEHYELHPIDRQTNGPQLFYGLRYHTHITKPGEVETFHDQVGYWLFRAGGRDRHLHSRDPPGPGPPGLRVRPGPKPPSSSWRATVGSEVHGILSNPFLDQAFRTLSYRIHVTVERRRDVVLRGRGGASYSRPPGALQPYRPQYLDEDRSA